MGRDALVAEAREEWAVDSTDESIAANCEKMVAAPGGVFHEQRGALEACLERASCQEYVDCVMPIHEEAFLRQDGRRD